MMARPKYGRVLTIAVTNLDDRKIARTSSLAVFCDSLYSGRTFNNLRFRDWKRINQLGMIFLLRLCFATCPPPDRNTSNWSPISQTEGVSRARIRARTKSES